MELPPTAPNTEAKSFWSRLPDFVENPFTLGAVFALGGIVGALLFTPAFVLCAFCILLGFHRAKVVVDKSPGVQALAFTILALIISIGGYFLYGWLDSAVQRTQTEFAEKVAKFRSPHEVKKEPPSESPAVTPKTEVTPHKVVRPIKNPLEIVAFRSDYGISIANNGPRSVHVISLLVKGHGENKSFALGLDIAPSKISEKQIHEEGILHVRTLMKLDDSWEGHFKKARELYTACGMQWEFFSPSDVSLQQIKDNYTGQNLTLGYSDISGILYYRIQGPDKTEEQTAPLVETIVVNNDTCPKLLVQHPAPSP